MDFDYQKMKDDETRQRDERLACHLIQHPIPIPRLSTTRGSPPRSRKPPVKPRRSIKCRPTTQPEKGESHNQASQKENEEVKRIAPSQVLSPAGPLDAQTPSLQAHNMLWFQITQLPRLPKPVPCWLHGFATRREAEQLLQDKPQGCFLLRLSESKVGFVLSYRGADKCRHFIIEEDIDTPGTEGQYLIVGENSRHHTLEELIQYYTVNPVGPFNETLTVPCAQPNGSCEDKAKLEIRCDVGECQETNKKTAAIPPSILENCATGSTEHVPRVVSESPQYAVVKKAIRKTHSLSECMGTPNELLIVEGNTHSGIKAENGTEESVFGNASTCVGGNVGYSTDAPYARVNKLPRAMSPTPINDTNASMQGASAAPDSQSFPNAAALTEQKYWELEAMHTYEETLHTRARDDQIDFYAMGRCKEKSGVAGDGSTHHIYSEVNIKGNREESIPMSASPPIRAGGLNSSSARPTPRLPLRPPPRLTHAAAQPDRIQRFTGSPVMTPPQHSGLHQSEQLLPGNSIYEQIPERPGKSRPPLPPPNPKR